MTSKKLSKALALALAVIMTVGLLTMSAHAATVTFTDVPSNMYYYDAVAQLANEGIVSGVGNNRFAPNNDVGNNAMVKMIVQAIYREDYAKYEEAHLSDMKAYFGDVIQWYSYLMYYGRDTGLLDYVDVAISVASSCNAPMNRYNMAQIMYNVVVDKGIFASDEQKSAAQAAIPDYASVPAQYREAVLTCYALGLLTGSTGGYFKGQSSMSRGQACVVIVRMRSLINSGSTGSQPSTPVTPEPPVVTPDPVPTVKEIVVTSKAATAYAPASSVGGTSAGNVSGTAWTVTDNKCGDGYLNNGKPITEDNVIELLMKAEAIWTNGMTWTGSAAKTGNNWWANASGLATNMMAGYNQGNGFGCNGYAAMISSYIFGATNNPLRKTTPENIRPGDIVLMMENGKVVHHFVAVSVPGGTYNKGTMQHDGYVFTTEGNLSNKVSWPDEWTAPDSPESSGTNWVVYTRYPQSPTVAPDPIVTPDPTPNVKEITVTGKAGSINVGNTGNQPAGTISGTAWTVIDNKFGNGRLNNGREITVDNVVELLQKAETIWTNGMTWTGTAAPTGNNWYANAGSITTNLMKSYGYGNNFACTGYAPMISDYIFGASANPVRQTTIDKIRPGDIIIEVENGKALHIFVATSVPGGTYGKGTMAHDGYIFGTGGNQSKKVSWPDEWTAPSSPEGESWDWVVYTRYPA